jgi:hypothetical protein
LLAALLLLSAESHTSEELTLLLDMTANPSLLSNHAHFFMDIVFDSSFAILAIIVPLGLAYIMLSLQTHKQQGTNRNVCKSTGPKRRKLELDSRNTQ